MPRPPKSYHPLRTLRLATPHGTQSGFAAYVGVSPATVQAVEQGKLKLTAQLAARIRELTGCSDAELLKGVAGKAKALDGKLYTAEHFTQWQGKLNRSLDTPDDSGAVNTGDLEEMFRMILLAARKSGGAAGVQAARTMAVESVERIRTKLHLTEGLEEMLLPLQQCTVLHGPAAEWKKIPKGTRKELVGPVTLPRGFKKLTLAWLASPSWSGGLPLKEKLASNVELFPPGYLVVCAGGAGCRIGLEFWKEAALQHGIDPRNGRALRSTPGGNWPAFFRKVSQRDLPERFVPRAAFVDLDAEVVEEIAKHHANFFHSGCFFASHEGVNNTYAGPTHAEAGRLSRLAMDFLAHQSGDVGAPSGMILLHSLEGGTGSGLGGHLLRQFKERWPASPAFCLAPTPQRQVSHVVVAPYNALLGINDIITHADGALFLDSEASGNVTVKHWGRDATEYAELNRLQALMLLMFLAPIRFPAVDAPPMLLRDWIVTLKNGGKAPWLGVPRLIPLQKCAPHGQRTEIAVATVAQGAMDMLKADLPENGHLTLLQQGRQGEKLAKTGNGRQPARLRLRPRQEFSLRDAVLCVGDFPDMAQALSFVGTQAGKLLKRRAYLQSFLENGVKEADFADAMERLAARLLPVDALPSLTPDPNA
jgi:transcriptional regulator with XRE-family HTH domain